MSRERQHYTFGDNAIAAERLRLLAQVFAPSSAELLSRCRLRDGQRTLAVDLGSGPGYTTELLHTHTQPRTTVGLERSPRLAAEARRRCEPPLTFFEHDVTSLPFPVPAADLLYARFLLTHLRDLPRLLAAWTDAAIPGGLLVLEENTCLASAHPQFCAYYALVEQMQAHYGQRTFIGLDLVSLCAQAGWTIVHAEERRLELPAASMAKLHALNLQTWGDDPYARANYDARALCLLRETFERIAGGEESAPPVTSGMKQIIARKEG